MVKIVKIAIKSILYGMFTLFFAIFIFILFLRVPYNQVRLAQYFRPKIEKAIGFPIQLRSIEFKFFNELNIHDIYIKDRQNNQMIFVKELDFNFDWSQLLFRGNRPLMTSARLIQPNVHLIQDAQTRLLNMNEFVKAIIAAVQDPNRPKNRPNALFTIKEIDIINGRFRLDINSKENESAPNHFDITHFELRDIHSSVKDFYVIGDTVGLKTIGLRAKDDFTGVNIKKLDTDFRISQTEMRFDDLSLYLNDSWVSKQLVFSYDQLEDVSDFINKVDIEADLKGSILDGKDVGIFISAMNQYPGKYRLSGNLIGLVKDLSLEDFELGFGSASVLRGDFDFLGLPNINQTQMTLKIIPSLILPQDLNVFLSQESLNKIKLFGKTRLTGNFSGTNQLFTFQGNAATNLGLMSGNVQFDLKEDENLSSYQGDIQLNTFQLGKLLNLEEYLSTVNLQGTIQGTGFTNSSANLDVDGIVSEINFNDYPYKNVALKGNLKQSLFNGIVSISDTNIQINTIGQIDLRDKIPHYSLNGIIRFANLQPLNFARDSIQIKSEFEGDFRLSSIDNLSGQLNLTDFLLKKKNSPDLVLKELNFNSNLNNPFERNYSFQSEILDAKLKGNFLPSDFIKDLKQVGNEYIQYFTLNKLEQNDYYQNAYKGDGVDYFADFNITLKQSSAILQRWFPDLSLSDQTIFNANVEKGKYFNLSIESYPDTMRIGDYNFYQSVLSFQSSKEFGGPGISSSLFYQSRKQQLNFLTPTENLKMDALWDQDKINFILDLKQENQDNLGHLNGQWKIENDGFTLKFKDSFFKLLGQNWEVDPANKMTLGKNIFQAEHVNIFNSDQSIKLSGKIAEDSTSILSIDADDFQLNTLKPLFSVSLDGTLNSSIKIRNWFQDSKIDAWTTIDDLALGAIKIGDMIGFGNYNPASKKMDLNFNFDRDNESFLIIDGTYQPNLSENYFDLNAELNRTSVNILEPFSKGIFSKFDGYASGYVHVGGELTNPDIEGKITVDSVQLVYDYLNQKSFVSDTIEFKNRSIIAKNWHLKDEEGNQALFNAKIEFQKNQPLFFDINTQSTNYKIINTERKEDSYYYGLGYGTGNAHILGKNNKVYIDGNIKTNEGTRLFIPLDKEYNTVEELGGYEFLSKTIEQRNLIADDSSKKNSDLGIIMDLNLEVTPEAYGEVIFDSEKGDLMRMYGTGNLNLGINPKGDFTLKGRYAIDQGDYTFSLQNIINKKFQIERNSSITWDGDPLDGKVDIKAIYTQYASLFPILLDTTNKGSLPEFKRRYPVDVTINLENELLSPDVSFQIGVRDYPKDVNFNSSVTAFTNRLQTDEQELTKQVSNLLLFGQLTSPYGANNLAIGNFVGNFTEMLSNQLSNLASRLNRNLSLDVFLGGGGFTQEFLSNLQLRASYNFNDRFRITRSGAFTDARNQTSARLLLGDWAAEWFIKKDGSLRLKGYNRNVQTSLAGSLESYQINQTFGTSISFQKNFDRLFFQKKKD